MQQTSIQIEALCCYPASMWKKYLQAMLCYLIEKNILSRNHIHLELIITHDRAMSIYNKRYMQAIGPTNILSFPYQAPHPLQNEDESTCHTTQNIGILILSVDTLEREAKLYGQKPTQYAIRLLAHGMTHLLGYDHGHAMDTLCQELEAATPHHTIYSFTPFWSFNHG